MTGTPNAKLNALDANKKNWDIGAPASPAAAAPPAPKAPAAPPAPKAPAAPPAPAPPKVTFVYCLALCAW
jgi:hypothetical protein